MESEGLLPAVCFGVSHFWLWGLVSCRRPPPSPLKFVGVRLFVLNE